MGPEDSEQPEPATVDADALDSAMTVEDVVDAANFTDVSTDRRTLPGRGRPDSPFGRSHGDETA